jgi:hypothetical protein
MRTLITVLGAAGIIGLLVAGASCQGGAVAKTEAAAAVVDVPADGVLFDFENDADVKAWGVEDDIKDKVALSVSAEHATSGKRSLKMVLKPHEWPGMNTKQVPKDWSAHAKLVLDIWAEQGADLNVRIDDANSVDYASRFQSGGSYVNKGKNEVTVWLTDVGAKIDLKKVTAMFIFCAPVDKDMTFYIDNIRLILDGLAAVLSVSGVAGILSRHASLYGGRKGEARTRKKRRPWQRYCAEVRKSGDCRDQDSLSPFNTMSSTWSLSAVGRSVPKGRKSLAGGETPGMCPGNPPNPEGVRVMPAGGMTPTPPWGLGRYDASSTGGFAPRPNT